MNGPEDFYLAIDLVGFTAGLAISALLLVLTLRAGRLPGTPVANMLVALCALFWNLGGLVCTTAMVWGAPPFCLLQRTAISVQFMAAAVWPLPMLGIWSPLAVERWQRIGRKMLLWAGLGSALVISAGLWTAQAGDLHERFHWLKMATSFNGSILLGAGGLMLLRGRTTPRTVWLASLTVMVGALGASVVTVFSHSAREMRIPSAIGQQSVLVVVLGCFLLFARFRFADIAIRYSYRILLASGAATLLVMIIESGWGQRLVQSTARAGVARFYFCALFASMILMLMAWIDRKVSRSIGRLIFLLPDYRAVLTAFAARLGRLHFEEEILAATRKAMESGLDVAAAETLPFAHLPASQWPPELMYGEAVEFQACPAGMHRFRNSDIELLVPVRVGGKVHTVLAISPGPKRRGLLTEEVRFLKSLADLLGHRIDSVQREREEVERRSREALLLQQVTEAELRALRAQINPHFLFNSLNTIADLIVTNPKRAETMTLRLAKVFRYVLAHSARPLTPVREEFEFLQTYLHIEEARFGDRLQVAIDVAPEIAGENIRSLILQPLVENALKHGLGPKPGPGHLWISARAENGHLRLSVEDDGVGLSGKGSGVGLSNVADRLSTLYQERAQVTLGAREAGGSQAVVLLPRLESEAVPA